MHLYSAASAVGGTPAKPQWLLPASGSIPSPASCTCARNPRVYPMVGGLRAAAGGTVVEVLVEAPRSPCTWRQGWRPSAESHVKGTRSPGYGRRVPVAGQGPDRPPHTPRRTPGREEGVTGTVTHTDTWELRGTHIKMGWPNLIWICNINTGR